MDQEAAVRSGALQHEQRLPIGIAVSPVCGSASKSDSIERRPRWLNSLYSNTLARMLTVVFGTPYRSEILSSFNMLFHIGWGPALNTDQQIGVFT